MIVCVCTCSKKWAAAPVGAADPGKTEWTPQQNVPIANSEQRYGCQCMKNCACLKETCRCASLDTRPTPQKPGYDQYQMVFGTNGAILTSAADSVKFGGVQYMGGKAVTKDGKVLKDGSKMGMCRCVRGGYCVVPVRRCARMCVHAHDCNQLSVRMRMRVRVCVHVRVRVRVRLCITLTHCTHPSDGKPRSRLLKVSLGPPPHSSSSSSFSSCRCGDVVNNKLETFVDG